MKKLRTCTHCFKDGASRKDVENNNVLKKEHQQTRNMDNAEMLLNYVRFGM